MIESSTQQIKLSVGEKLHVNKALIKDSNKRRGEHFSQYLISNSLVFFYFHTDSALALL